MRRHLSGVFRFVKRIFFKPMENVLTRSVENCVANAATVEESTPPLNKIPKGTSATSCILTASASSSRKSDAAFRLSAYCRF
jgi:hypothetical protein